MNKENYKKAIDQIHPREELNQEIYKKILNNKKRRSLYLKYIAACAMAIVVLFIGNQYLYTENNVPVEKIATEKKVEKIKNDLPRFKSMEELKDVLKEADYRVINDTLKEATISLSKGDSVEDLQNSTESVAMGDYSTTNVQVENVDEADIIKTDGEYIYYISNNKIIIIKADTLEIITKINEITDDTNKKFSPNEIFIKDNILVALGNEFEYIETKTRTTKETTEESTLEDLVTTDVARISTYNTAKAIVYDISDKNIPIIKREVELDGFYSNSRMIGDNVYFISTKKAFFSDEMKDNEILPIYRDTAISNNNKIINYTDIAYFEGTENYNFTLVAGFNIKNQEEVHLETFLGSNNTVYASEKNLYLSQINYNFEHQVEKSIIYKFNLEDSQIILQCKGEVVGNLNNQFAMDEYKGNLRIAATDYSGEESKNQLYILDENLKEIGKIENMAPGEKIYSVRFIGKIGYVVTFKQIDPLFVIDLSNPTAPEIKGELKIPGYSSYLHPYDETHIIGIGYNTKTNEYGSTTNTTMKMSMFDVSDLENPKEMFNINIGETSAYSEVSHNHKALFYNKNKSLIGFPVTIRVGDANNDTNNFVLYEINLEEGFKEYGRIKQKIDYRTNIDRAIYIKDTLYTLSDTQIVSYNLNTMEELNILKFEGENDSENILIKEEIIF